MISWAKLMYQPKRRREIGTLPLTSPHSCACGGGRSASRRADEPFSPSVVELDAGHMAA